MDKELIKARLEYWKEVYEKYQNAYIALIEGQVKSYTIDDRQLSRWDLKDIADLMEDAEKKIDELSALLENKRPRKAFGVLPRDW